jgi:hypothetical protein
MRNGKKPKKYSYLQHTAYGRQQTPFEEWIISALTGWFMVSVFYLAERVLCLHNTAILCNFIRVMELRFRMGLCSETHITIQASVESVQTWAITAIRRQSRFCQLRISSIHAFPQLSIFLRLEICPRTHTHKIISMLSPPRGPHSLEEGV